jgi:CheY-like chemotaxis protein
VYRSGSTLPSGAQVRVRAKPEPTRVRFEVQDHGAGIPEEFRSRIFEKFAQADGSASRRFEGTGLGLSITRQLVQAMGGTIGFTSTEGAGTTFYFDLPRLQPPSTSTHSAASASTAPEGPSNNPAHTTATGSTIDLPIILHVEDDADLSNILSTTLAGRATVICAPTLQAARQLLQTQPFSVLVLDPGLPDGNGLTLLEEVSHLHPQPLPIIILSVTEVGPEIQQRVTAAIVKSRVSESRIAEIILSALPNPSASKIA